MDRADIMKYLAMVSDELGKNATLGEIVLTGGAVMLLVIKSRAMTKDVDAYFGISSDQIRDAARTVAAREGLPKDWLNDGVKGFFYGTPPQTLFAEFPNLHIYSVTPEYMIAMKVAAGRVGDMEDLKALIRFLGITNSEDVMRIVEQYIPERLLTARMQYSVAALFEDDNNG